VTASSSSTRALWFGLWGAPAAWSVQLLIDYPVAAHACYPHRVPLTGPTGGALQPITAIVALAALVVALAAMTVSARSGRTAGDATGNSDMQEEERSGPQPLSRVRFMSAAGLMTSTLFAFGIVLSGAAPALVSPCW